MRDFPLPPHDGTGAPVSGRDLCLWFSLVELRRIEPLTLCLQRTCMRRSGNTASLFGVSFRQVIANIAWQTVPGLYSCSGVRAGWSGPALHCVPIPSPSTVRPPHMSWFSSNGNNILNNTKRTKEELVTLNESIDKLVKLQEEQNMLLRKVTDRN